MYYRSHEIEEVTAGNGVTKVYIGCPYTATHYAVGDIVGIYRKYTGEESKGNRSAITSFCTITKITTAKDNGKIMIGEEEYLRQAGDKMVFTQNELLTIYRYNKNIVMIEMLYNGFFAKGRNVTYWQLKNNGLFDDHPYNICYSIANCNSKLKQNKKSSDFMVEDCGFRREGHSPERRKSTAAWY